jgi:transcriptional regulator with XRE-family HTH domain
VELGESLVDNPSAQPLNHGKSQCARCERKQPVSEKLAKLPELHRNYVGGVERGERNVGLLNIVRLARALDVKASKLMEAIRWS